mgnify:FL=1
MYVHILGTGGTISSRTREGAGATATDGAASLAEMLTAEIRATDVLTTGSYLLTFADLRILVKAVQEALADDDCVGVVVTHGTDTMEETAFLLDLVHTSDKPVVLTGAQRAADSSHPDGPDNLADAVAAAASPALRECGVLVCFAGQVRSARGVRKTQTWELTAFDGGTLVAEMRDGEAHVLARPRRYPPLPLPTEAFDNVRVEIVPCFLGATPRVLAHVIDDGADGIVLAGTGIGNAGVGFVDEVARAVAAGIPVVLASRVVWGPIKPIYGNGGGVDLVGAGAIPSGDLNAPQSRMLMALLLGKGVGDKFADNFVAFT